MRFLDRLFRKKHKTQASAMPSSWDEIVELMYGKDLDAFSDEVVDVIYSRDRSMRYVILRGDDGLLTYRLEAIFQFDEDEWQYLCSKNGALPAMWEPFSGNIGSSVFENMDELMNELRSEPEFKRRFNRSHHNAEGRRRDGFVI